jgi:hypothetical protein
MRSIANLLVAPPTSANICLVARHSRTTATYVVVFRWPVIVFEIPMVLGAPYFPILP